MFKNWNPRAVETIASQHAGLLPGDPGYSAYTGDVVLEGKPDVVLRPRSENDVRDIAAHAFDRGIPITVAGGQTSLTGSSVAEAGILLPTEGMDRLLDLRRDPVSGRMTAVAEPGILLGDFQRALETEGWYYPPDPTSKNEAMLGATVATNATGEDSLLYGPTRNWVRALRVVTADGRRHVLKRTAEPPVKEEKATAGYYPAREEIDLLIGSEGTLAIITEVTVEVIPPPHGVFSGVAFFPSLVTALEFVRNARTVPTVSPRALELMDRASLDLVAENPEGIVWPQVTKAAVSFKQEFRDPAERERLEHGWFQLITETVTATDLLDHILIMENRSDQERLRSFRHRIPSRVNEVAAERGHGEWGKVGTDWWVPYPHIGAVLEGWRNRIADENLEAVIFGHIGNGHPHINFFPRSRTELARAQILVAEMCREAVSLGGGVAGEHGLGKLKRNLLEIQYKAERIREMRDIKHEWDPRWILGRGNLFPEEPS